MIRSFALIASAAPERLLSTPSPDAGMWAGVIATFFAALFIVVVVALRRAGRMVDPRLAALCEATGLKLHGLAVRGRYRDRHLTIDTAVTGPRRAAPSSQERRRVTAMRAVSTGSIEALSQMSQVFSRLFKTHRKIRSRSEIRIEIELVPARLGVTAPPRDAWKPVTAPIRELLQAGGIGRQEFACRLHKTSLHIAIPGDKFEDAAFLRKLLDAALDAADGILAQSAPDNGTVGL